MAELQVWWQSIEISFHSDYIIPFCSYQYWSNLWIKGWLHLSGLSLYAKLHYCMCLCKYEIVWSYFCSLPLIIIHLYNAKFHFCHYRRKGQIVFLSVLYYSLMVNTVRTENNIFIHDGFIRLWVKNSYIRQTWQNHCSMGTNAWCARQQKWCYEVTWSFSRFLRDSQLCLSCEINFPDSRPAQERELYVRNDLLFSYSSWNWNLSCNLS
jgi:hypothetical protein